MKTTLKLMCHLFLLSISVCLSQTHILRTHGTDSVSQSPPVSLTNSSRSLRSVTAADKLACRLKPWNKQMLLWTKSHQLLTFEYKLLLLYEELTPLWLSHFSEQIWDFSGPKHTNFNHTFFLPPSFFFRVANPERKAKMKEFIIYVRYIVWTWPSLPLTSPVCIQTGSSSTVTHICFTESSSSLVRHISSLTHARTNGISHRILDWASTHSEIRLSVCSKAVALVAGHERLTAGGPSSAPGGDWRWKK